MSRSEARGNGGEEPGGGPAGMVAWGRAGFTGKWTPASWTVPDFDWAGLGLCLGGGPVLTRGDALFLLPASHQPHWLPALNIVFLFELRTIKAKIRKMNTSKICNFTSFLFFYFVKNIFISYSS